jgi:3-phenylpropionate/trans-cinnamate dioxygenase ferredoxin reductase component
VNKICVIVGMSHAGVHVAVNLRKFGWVGEIIMVGDEEILPYHRPPLSKKYLKQDAEPAFIYSDESLKELNIQYRLGQKVSDVDRQNKFITLEDGSKIVYDKLVLCTGATPRKIDFEGDSSQKIFYLRNIEDADLIKKNINGAKKVLIVGAGFIGLEIAASLKELGVEVTILENSHRILSRNLDQEMSDYMLNLHKEKQVNILTNTTVSKIEKLDSLLRVFTDQDSIFDVDFIIVGIGVIPNIELAHKANLNIENGIQVDEYGMTSDKNIYAAGDCTSFPCVFNKTFVRLECLSNAVDQAKVVAQNLCKVNAIHDSTPWFWSEQYDRRIQIIGTLPKKYQVFEKLVENKGLCRVYIEDDHIRMVVCINAAVLFNQFKKILNLNSKRVFKDVESIDDYLSMTLS